MRSTHSGRVRVLALAALVASSGLNPMALVAGSDEARAQAGPASRATHPAPAGPGRTWQWWNDASVQKELGLTPDRVRRIDEIFQSRKRQAQPYADEFLRNFRELERMTAERVADEASYELQVAHVEALRSKLNEGRTVMLYKIYLQLDPQQYQKLREIVERRARENRESGRR